MQVVDERIRLAKVFDKFKTWIFVSEKTLKTYGELNGDLHLVAFDHGSDGLGLRLAGNRNLALMSVFVVGIQSSGPVAQDGRIKIGDELLEVRCPMVMQGSYETSKALNVFEFYFP